MGRTVRALAHISVLRWYSHCFKMTLMRAISEPGDFRHKVAQVRDRLRAATSRAAAGVVIALWVASATGCTDGNPHHDPPAPSAGSGAPKAGTSGHAGGGRAGAGGAGQAGNGAAGRGGSAPPSAGAGGSHSADAGPPDGGVRPCDEDAGDDCDGGALFE